jgi:PLP dependent protein
MTVPPMARTGEEPATAARPHFATLRALRDDARSRYPEVVHLSMGMSADLEAAIAEGATVVRIGTAIFGERGDGPWQPTDQEPPAARDPGDPDRAAADTEEQR